MVSTERGRTGGEGLRFDAGRDKGHRFLKQDFGLPVRGFLADAGGQSQRVFA
jgi:hypothetical protein